MNDGYTRKRLTWAIEIFDGPEHGHMRKIIAQIRYRYESFAHYGRLAGNGTPEEAIADEMQFAGKRILQFFYWEYQDRLMKMLHENNIDDGPVFDTVVGVCDDMMMNGFTFKKNLISCDGESSRFGKDYPE